MPGTLQELRAKVVDKIKFSSFWGLSPVEAIRKKPTVQSARLWEIQWRKVNQGPEGWRGGSEAGVALLHRIFRKDLIGKGYI